MYIYIMSIHVLCFYRHYVECGRRQAFHPTTAHLSLPPRRRHHHEQRERNHSLHLEERSQEKTTGTSLPERERERECVCVPGILLVQHEDVMSLVCTLVLYVSSL